MLPSSETRSESKQKQQQEEHFTESSPKAALRSSLPCRQPLSFCPSLSTSRQHGTALGMCSLWSTGWNRSKESRERQEGTTSPVELLHRAHRAPAGGKGAQTESGLHQRIPASPGYEQVTGNYSSTLLSSLVQICNWKDHKQGAFCFCLEWKTCSPGFCNQVSKPQQDSYDFQLP